MYNYNANIYTLYKVYTHTYTHTHTHTPSTRWVKV